MDWTILGIEPTKEKKAITAAYRAKLKHTNPEEKPEEFKALRAAYEAALEYAASEETAPVKDTSPVGLWMDKVRAVYQNFPVRIDPDSWAELLMDEAVLAMDTRPQAEEALLRFFMDDYFLPTEVWQLLNDHFHWTERTEELYEVFPREFIDYAVINGIRLQPNMPYELFSPGLNGADCDTYRRLYHEATQVPVDEMAPLLDKMDALSESHPYGALLRCRLDFMKAETRGGAMEVARAQAEAYPANSFLQMEWASMCAMTGDWATAEQVTSGVLELQPDHFMAKRLLADALAGRGAYDEAKEHIYDLMRAVGGDQMQTYHLGQTLRHWNEELISQKEALLMADPDNSKNAIELGWCYLQNDRFDDALRAALMASPEYEDQYDYYNFLSKVHYAREEYEPALKNFLELERVMLGLDPTADEKTAKRKRRLPEVVQLQGSCLMALERKAEGKEKYLKAVELDPDNAEILTYTARMFAGTKDYEAAVPLLERVIELMPTSYHGHYLLGQVYYEQGRDRDALDCVDKALNYEGGDLGVYVLKMRVFIRNGVWEPVREILAFLDEHKVGEDPTVLWCKGQVLEFADNNRPDALVLYKQVAAKLEEGFFMDWASKVYHRIAAISMDTLDMNKQEDRDYLMEVVEKGLKYDPEDPNCLEYKGWLLRRNDKVEESLEIYHKLEAYAYHPIAVEYNLAELYYKNLKKNAHKALEYYWKLIEKDEQADHHFYAGTANRYLHDFKAAEMHFLREQELNPEDVDGYNGLAYVYEAMGRTEDALAQVNKAIALSQKQKGSHQFLYTHKVQILRRLNRAQDAIDAVYDTMARHESFSGYELIFDICCQFALWSKAQMVLDTWKLKEGPTSAWAAASVKLLRLSGHPIKAELVMGTMTKYLENEDKENLQLDYNGLQGRYEKVAKTWEDRLDWNDKSHVLLNLAQAEYFAGQHRKAREYAQRALDLLDDILQQHLTDEALYRTRRAMVLALLGRDEEARAELARCRELPLCAGCDYCSCKDADIFEAEIEEVLGNKARAKQLYNRFAEKWPDELDFIIGKNRMKKG